MVPYCYLCSVGDVEEKGQVARYGKASCMYCIVCLTIFKYMRSSDHHWLQPHNFLALQYINHGYHHANTGNNHATD